MERYVLRSLITNVIWAFSGDGRLKIRQELSDFIRNVTTIPLPPQDNVPIIDFEACYCIISCLLSKLIQVQRNAFFVGDTGRRMVSVVGEGASDRSGDAQSGGGRLGGADAGYGASRAPAADVAGRA